MFEWYKKRKREKERAKQIVLDELKKHDRDDQTMVKQTWKDADGKQGETWIKLP